MSLDLIVDPERPILEVELIPTAVPIPLRILGTDQFNWRTPFINELEGLRLSMGEVRIAHNTLYRYALDEFGALVHSIDNMTLETANTKSMIEDERFQRVEQTFAITQQINTLIAVTEDTSAKIRSEELARADAVSALTLRLDTQISRVDDAYAKIEEERLTRTTLNNSLAQDIEVAKAALEGNIAEVQVGMQTEITAVNGMVDSILASYGVTLTVNGLVGGFYTSNDGSSVSAHFDVDNFSVGRTLANSRKPFSIIDDVTYIDDAMIRKLSFDKLQATDGSLIVEDGKVRATYLQVDSAQSSNYLVGSSGWKLFSNGYAEFRDVLVRGDVQATSIKANTVFSDYAEFTNVKVRGDIHATTMTTNTLTADHIIADQLAAADIFNSGAVHGTSFYVNRPSKVLVIMQILYGDSSGDAALSPQHYDVGIQGTRVIRYGIPMGQGFFAPYVVIAFNAVAGWYYFHSAISGGAPDTVSGSIQNTYVLKVQN